MKYTPRHYAESLYNALEHKEGTVRRDVLSRFMIVLHKNHDAKHVRRILVEYEKLYLQKHNLRKIDIVSASPLESGMKQDIESILGKALLTESVDPELVAGLSITVDDEYLIDASAKTMISNLFTI